MKNYSSQFWLMCLSSFFFFSSFNIVIPVLPKFLDGLGGKEYLGFIIGLFTVSAAISRPFSGRLTDLWGRLPVMVFGAVVTSVVTFMYPFVFTVAGFLILRFFHGFSTGFTPTGLTSYVSDIVPFEQRATAMGIMSFFGTTGMGAGFAFGGWLLTHVPMDWIFYISTGVSLLSLALMRGIRETLEKKSKFHPRMMRITAADLIEPKAIRPAVVMLLCTFSFGAVLTLIPDFSDFIGIRNPGIFMGIFVVASLVSRVFGGVLSDKNGRAYVLYLSIPITTIGLVITGFADSRLLFFTGAIFYGFGYGLMSPSLFAWVADWVPVEFKGRGFSTLFIALEVGIGSGAFVSGWAYQNDPGRLPFIFWGAAGLAFLSFIYLVLKRKTNA
jgi:MFS family permease